MPVRARLVNPRAHLYETRLPCDNSVMKKPCYKRWTFYVLLAILVAILCEAALFTAVAVNARRLDDPQPADAILILGARIRPDGTPTPALERRLDRALELYQAGYAPLVITTGARGNDEPMPEADAMRTYLLERGVPADAVLAENASYNTIESLENAKAMLDARGLSSAIIVTSDYHLWRALSMCRDIGLAATGAGSQNALTFPVAIRNILQETLSWVKYVLTR